MYSCLREDVEKKLILKAAKSQGGKRANEYMYSFKNFEFLNPRRATKYSIHRVQLIVLCALLLI